MFIKLLDTNTFGEHIDYMQRCWSLLQDMEKEALRNKKLKTFLKDRVFPSMPFVRELFIGLEETEWKELPAPLAQDLESWLTCQHSTLLNENLNKWVRACDKQTAIASVWDPVLRGIASWLQRSGVISGGLCCRGQLLLAPLLPVPRRVCRRLPSTQWLRKSPSRAR